MRGGARSNKPKAKRELDGSRKRPHHHDEPPLPPVTDTEPPANLELDAPLGPIKLDENRQAIMDNFLQQIVEDQTGDGVPDVQTLATIPEVDQTFAGAFSPETPSPDRTNPPCEEGTPPPWTEQGGGR